MNGTFKSISKKNINEYFTGIKSISVIKSYMGGYSLAIVARDGMFNRYTAPLDGYYIYYVSLFYHNNIPRGYVFDESQYQYIAIEQRAYVDEDGSLGTRFYKASVALPKRK